MNRINIERKSMNVKNANWISDVGSTSSVHDIRLRLSKREVCPYWKVKERKYLRFAVYFPFCWDKFLVLSRKVRANESDCRAGTEEAAKRRRSLETGDSVALLVSSGHLSKQKWPHADKLAWEQEAKSRRCETATPGVSDAPIYRARNEPAQSKCVYRWVYSPVALTRARARSPRFIALAIVFYHRRCCGQLLRRRSVMGARSSKKNFSLESTPAHDARVRAVIPDGVASGSGGVPAAQQPPASGAPEPNPRQSSQEKINVQLPVQVRSNAAVLFFCSLLDYDCHRVCAVFFVFSCTRSSHAFFCDLFSWTEPTRTQPNPTEPNRLMKERAMYVRFSRERERERERERWNSESSWLVGDEPTTLVIGSTSRAPGCGRCCILSLAGEAMAPTHPLSPPSCSHRANKRAVEKRILLKSTSFTFPARVSIDPTPCYRVCHRYPTRRRFFLLMKLTQLTQFFDAPVFELEGENH